jgi:hypothetical protein
VGIDEKKEAEIMMHARGTVYDTVVERKEVAKESERRMHRSEINDEQSCAEEESAEILKNLMMHPNCVEEDEGERYRRRVRTWGKPKTQHAPADSELPLHQKAVGLLNWEQADAVVKAYAHRDWDMWQDLTRPFRDDSFWNDYEVETSTDDEEGGMNIEDATQLVAGKLLKEVQEDEIKQFAKSFTIIEEAKQRRRWIVWPAEFNQRSRRWRKERGGSVSFPSMETLKARVERQFARCLDFAAFFHQFAMSPKCALFFGIKIGDRFFVPTTVPTGAVQPPLFAQILMGAICAAVQSGNDSIDVDGFIDNIRIAGETKKAVDAATGVLKHLLNRIGITLNAEEDESPEYVFLGMKFSHTRKEVSLGPKTILKLEEMSKNLWLRTSRADCLAFFGVCVWASMVLAIPRVNKYYIYKFIRRRSAGRLDADVRIWPSILQSWDTWISQLRRNVPTRPAVDTGLFFTVVTDSSTSGYGGICYNGTGTAPEKIVGARWNLEDAAHFKERTVHQFKEVSGFWQVEDERHINMKELATVRNVLERLQVSNCTIDVVMDNTSALGMLRKMDSAKYEYNRELARLQEVLARKGISIRGLSYVNTAFNTADGLSRLQRQ